ncbi:hypothetical protein CDL60_17275 [Roseateles noduli]|nr:hypothetical protein CDL60_17275 [Roseateles noduli]
MCDDGFYGPLPVTGPWYRFGGFGGFPWGWGGLGHGHGHGHGRRHGRHCHHGRHGHHGGHGWDGFGGGLGSDAYHAGRGERLQARAVAFLDLSDSQSALLERLIVQLATARRAVKALARGPEVARLVDSENFRREEAQELFDGQIEALRATGPALVAAVGDFFDALDFDQLQMLRFLLRRLRRRAGRGGEDRDERGRRGRGDARPDRDGTAGTGDRSL